jgi:hypothetical protein
MPNGGGKKLPESKSQGFSIQSILQTLRRTTSSCLSLCIEMAGLTARSPEEFLSEIRRIVA